jgi:FkbM family methyltransferase
MIGSYTWQLKLLRNAAARTGGFPQQLYRKLRRLIRRAPSRPYFVTTSANGVLFLGDFRDSFSVACAVVPKYNEGVISVLTESALTRPGGFVDVGANAGIVAASVALNLRGISNVYAIEAEEQTARRAAATFALNRLTNVRLYHCAAGNHDGRGTLYSVPQASAIASLGMTDLLREHSNVMTTPTSVRTLDSLAEEFRWDSISLLKVDVEGQEYAVLRGAAGLINRHKPTILYENNPMTLSDDPAAPSGPPDLPGYQQQSIPGGGILRENGPVAVQSGSDILCIPRK